MTPSAHVVLSNEGMLIMTIPSGATMGYHHSSLRILGSYYDYRNNLPSETLELASKGMGMITIPSPATMVLITIVGCSTWAGITIMVIPQWHVIAPVVAIIAITEPLPSATVVTRTTASPQCQKFTK